MQRRVVLIRHGRSSHVQFGWIDRDGFLRWREAYEAAGITDAPPEALLALLNEVTCVIASDTRRTVESARALAPERDVMTSPLLAELELAPPQIGRLRLPMTGWKLAFAGAWISRAVRRIALHSPSDEERVEAAAKLIDEVTEAHGSVAVVTHVWFRRQLIAKLIARGWEKESFKGGSRNWSAWSLTRRVAKVRT